ncbi:MAG TPA: FadR/GntR family transcriptional regulator [Micromonosporaceae bacterium]
MPLRAPERGTLVPKVIAALQAQIASGEWRVGERIPPEPELAAALGVGRNTLREAVLALVHAGLLERRQGSGTYVVGSRELASAVARRVADAHLAEVVEVRRALEVEAARLAALRRTEADLIALDAALQAREEAWRGGDAGRFIDADVILHQSIVAAAHNRVLSELYADFSAALRTSLADLLGPDLASAPYVDHARLVAAIRSGDPGSAATEAAAYLEVPPPEA